MAISREELLKADRSEDLPHEFLLKVARGLPVSQKRQVTVYHESGPKAGQIKCKEWREEIVYPNLQTRMDAAKTAAPYYAPKLAVKVLETGDAGKDLVEAFKNAAINRQRPNQLEELDDL